MSLVFVTNKVPRLWEKTHKFGVPFLKNHPIFTDFVIEKWATIPYENPPLDKVGNRPVNMHIDQTSGQYWF